jgi:hypothetical protein
MILCFDGECHVRLNFVFAATALAPSHILHFWGLSWNSSLWLDWQRNRRWIWIGEHQEGARTMTKTGRDVSRLRFFLSLPCPFQSTPRFLFQEQKI